MDIENKKRIIKRYRREKVVRLILACFRKDVDAEQAKELEEWVSESEKNRALFERLQDSDHVQKELHEYQGYDSAKDWEKLRSRLMPRERARRYTWGYAASAMLLCALGAIAWYLMNTKEEPVQHVQAIEYGRSKAILFLESGKAIALEAGYDTLHERVEGENFVNDGKKLVYTEKPETKTIEWHTLQVPRGGEFVLNLADGTIVTLNADSKIRYPAQFSGTERQVLLEGEAFFEVTKDSLRPFVVKTNGMDVRVLGTSFNLKAYPDENQQTTLVRGAVEVLISRQQVLLSPGEQVTCTNGVLTIEDVDIKPYIAWKDERFVFENESLEGVLKKLERWYNMDVFIQNPALRKMRFTGNLPKYENINKVLDLIALTTKIKFELNDRILVVQGE